MVDAHAHSHLHSDPTRAADASLAALRATGERVTQPRRAVLEVLAEHSEHFSADQIATLLDAGPRPVHRATVYRTLDRLAELGIATTMTVPGGATVYHLAAAPGGHSHLHARCRSCGSVAVLPPSALDDARRVAVASGFELEPMQSTLVGLCAECARVA